MSTAPNALAALIAYQDQYGTMPAPGQPITSSAIWSGNSFTFPSGTPLADPTFIPAPTAANIPLSFAAAVAPPPAPPPVVVNPVPISPAPAVLLNPAPAAPISAPPVVVNPTPLPPAPPPVVVNPTPPPPAPPPVVVNPVPTSPAPAVLLNPAPAAPAIVPVPQAPYVPLIESQWVAKFPQFSTDTSPTTTCAPSLQYAANSGRVFCAQPDASGNPTLPLPYWEDVYSGTYGGIIDQGRLAQVVSYLNLPSYNSAVSLPDLLRAFAAVGYGPATPIVVNPVPTAPAAVSSNGSSSPAPPAPPPVVVNPVPTALTPPAAAAAPAASDGNIIPGFPNAYLFIGAGALVMVLMLTQGK